MKKKLLFIIFIVVFLGGTGFFVYKNFVSKNHVDSTQFQLSKRDNGIIWNQDIAELNLQESAIPEWRNRIEKLSKEVEILESDVEKRAYYDDLGIYHSYLGEYRKSYDYYIKSLDISPVYRITWMQLGDLLVKMRAYYSAEIAYLKGNEINPYVDMNYQQLAELYDKMGDMQKAIAIYDQGIKIIGDSGNSIESLLKLKARYLEDKKMYSDAIKTYEELLKKTEDKEGVNNKILKIKEKLNVSQ
ncbi:MAG TPA: hypothetical protein PKL13_01875 [bacterium]|nr:hypothetical protein [bacterium]